MIRNMALAGEPLFSFTTTRAFVLGADLNYPDLEMLLHGPVGTADVFRKYGPDILAKVSRNLWPNILNPVAWIGSPTLGLFIWLALVCSRIISDARRTTEFILFRNSLLVLILVNFVTVALVLLYDRFFEFLYPLVILAGVQEGGSLLQLIVPPRARQGLLAGATVILLAAGILRARDISLNYRDSEPADAAESRSFQILAERIEPGSVVASDFSHKITVYDDLLTVRLPVKPPELLEISHDFLPIDYVVFSAGIAAADPRTHSSMFGNYTGYQAFMRSAAFLDEFEFVEELPNGAILYRRRK
jgi:hypothetical protein